MLGQEPLNLTIDERNGKLLTYENQIAATPTEFQKGDRVKPSALGMQTALFEANEQFIVADVGSHVAKWAQDPARTVELWNFSADGVLKRTISDPRFLELVERKDHKPTKPKKGSDLLLK